METTDVAISSECFYEECWFFALFMEGKALVWNGIFYIPDLIPVRVILHNLDGESQ